MSGAFAAYLAEPCDHVGCELVATHNGYDRTLGIPGRYCNQHTDRDRQAFARND